MKIRLKVFWPVIAVINVFFKLFFNLNKTEARGQREAYGSYWKKHTYWDKLSICV